MSTSIIEPGARLAGRYRLEDRVSESVGSALWKAIDEILARPVAIRTFESDFPRAGEVVTAARAASRLTDPRLTQVFDADDSGERAYVVSEWVVGESLIDLLQHGPMEPERAATLVAEAAEALTAAHLAGLSHLRLTPTSLVWTTGGTVKVTGLAVEGALAGAASRAGECDPATIDTRGLGRLLYAAVTAHWPSDAAGGLAQPTDGLVCGLPEAPVAAGELCAPHQLQAGVPYALDTVICRALGVHLRGGQRAFTQPAEIAEALAQVPRVPLPLFMGLQTGPPPAIAARPAPSPQPEVRPTTAGFRNPAAPSRPASPRPVPQPTRAGESIGAPPAPRHRSNDGQINKPLVGLAAALAVVVVGVGGWQLSHLGGRATPPTPTSSVPSRAQTAVLSVDHATGFDPQGDGNEKSDKAHLAIDSRPATAWTTDGYNSVDFGKLKKGVGLLLDMGKPVKVAEVKVTLAGPTGSVLQLRVGDSQELSGLRRIGNSTDISGTIDFHPAAPAQGRYVLLWFTRLAPDSGQSRGQISDVVVRGTAS